MGRGENIGELIGIGGRGLMIGTPAVDAKTLFDYDDGSGTVLGNWTRGFDQWGNIAWVLDDDPVLGTPIEYNAGDWRPMQMNKSDYGQNNQALIRTTDRAPDKVTGGCLAITCDVVDVGGQNDGLYTSSWNVWYDGQPLSRSIGLTDATTNRMSYYLKMTGTSLFTLAGGTGDDSDISVNFHVGTFLCWGSGGSGQGDGCPHESPNQHYYHYLAINPGGWIHVQLDRHPQHQREVPYPITNLPKIAYPTEESDYYQALFQYYMEGPRYGSTSPTEMLIDEIKYYTEEQAENEISIASLCIGYFPDTNDFQMGWCDTSFENSIGDQTQSTFQIRWSLNPITNTNWDSATEVIPEAYSGEAYTGADIDEPNGLTNLIRRPNSWSMNVWTKFSETPFPTSGIIYFAAKDVSVLGEHIGTSWPYDKVGGDGHDAPDTNIRTITYHMPTVPIMLDSFETGVLEEINPLESDPEKKYLWNQYTGDFTEGPDPGLTSISSTDPQSGSYCLLTTVSAGAAYVQFYSYDQSTFTWGWVRDFIKSGTWQFDTYNKLRFWVKLPADGDYEGLGNQNLNLGTYFRGINGDHASAESDGGNHYYHKFDIKPTGEWHQIIISFHADYVRGGDASIDDPGVQEYPTNQAGYNYFDLMTRFYFELENVYFDQSHPQLTYLDNFEIYQDTNVENILQVFNIHGTYVPGTNEIVMGWSRNKLDDYIFFEVRYYFSSIHHIGWDNALNPPNNRFDPPTHWDYNNMYYEDSTIDLTGHTSVFFAVKPDNSDLFTEIEILL